MNLPHVPVLFTVSYCQRINSTNSAWNPLGTHTQNNSYEYLISTWKEKLYLVNDFFFFLHLGQKVIVSTIILLINEGDSLKQHPHAQFVYKLRAGTVFQVNKFVLIQ